MEITSIATDGLIEQVMFNKSCTHKCIQINSQGNLPFVKTGADPEDNLLNEISQRKEIAIWYHLDEKSKKNT